MVRASVDKVIEFEKTQPELAAVAFVSCPECSGASVGLAATIDVRPEMRCLIVLSAFPS